MSEDPFQNLVDGFLKPGASYRVEEGGAVLAEGVLGAAALDNHVLRLDVGGLRLAAAYPFSFSLNGNTAVLRYDPPSLGGAAMLLHDLVPQREEPYPFAASLGGELKVTRL